MEWKEGTPKYGDLIRTKVSFYHHYGIFADESNVIQFGLPDDPGKPAEQIEVLSTDIYTFLQGGNLEIGIPSKEEKKKLRTPEKIVSIAQSKLGSKGYDILHNNCEHFMNECAFGEGSSHFLEDVREKIRAKLGK